MFSHSSFPYFPSPSHSSFACLQQSCCQLTPSGKGLSSSCAKKGWHILGFIMPTEHHLSPPCTQWLCTLRVMCFLHGSSNWTPENCREKKRGCGCRQTHRRRLLPERNKFVYNRSAQGQMHLCCTALVSVKSNQFDFHQVQPMRLHPFNSRSTFLEKKGRGGPN